MTRPTHKTLLYGAAGALGGSTAWAFVLALSASAAAGLRTEILLGAVTGVFLGGFIWSHEALAGRQFGTAIRRAAFGAAAGLLGGALGAGLGNTIFSILGRYAAEQSGFAASLGIILAVSLGWAILGAAIGISGGLMIRSRERAWYGLAGGSLGGLLGGGLYSVLATASFWPVLAGLALLGFSIGALISLVEEAFVSAKVRVIKGRHLNREFPLLKEMNVIGRDDRSDVCLSGAEGVALQHAGIKRNNGHYLIETDEQGKAVYVNQVLTRNSKLADGDVIRVGSILLMFSAVKKAAAIAAVVLLAGLAAPVFAGEPTSAQITQFDLGSFPVVKAYVSVLDGNGKPVRGLTKENAVLLENGQQMSIDSMATTGTGGDREPLSLAIVLDRSGSMSGEKIERAKESVLRFIALMEPGDRAAFIAFSDTVALLEPLTNDQARLTNAVQAIEPEGHTALYDAIAQGAGALKDVPGRKAVVVLTDGIANRGSLDIHQAIAEAVKDYISVTVIGLGADVRTARLERIAVETGGSYFFTPAASGLAEIYEAVSKRIRNEYVVTYHTQDRADYLRNVFLTLSAGPTAMRSYFQPDSSLFGSGKMRPPYATFAMSLLSLLGLMAISLRTMERQYATGHLSLVRGKGTTKGIDIGKTVTIGAAAGSTIGLTRDRTIAPQHAEVVQENGRYVIEDKGAATGTFVNKRKVTGRQTLRDGDVIDVGNATIVFSEPTMQACRGCGEALRPGAKFCAKCGVKTA
ncbi:MAG: VWA domain-containing protein [Nitrospirota bacterium]